MRLIGWLSLIALIFIIYAFKCPGAGPDDVCGSCNDGKCYSDFDGMENEKGICCKNIHQLCPVTGMKTFHSKSGRVYKHKWSSILEKLGFYEDPISKAGCPIPQSYQLREFGKVPPVDFTEKATKLKKCQFNKDCGDGEFCDSTFNPSDNAKDTSSKFCFKVPDILGKTEAVIKRGDTDDGVIFCNDKSQCSVSGGFCFKDLPNPPTPGFTGICAIAPLCSNPQGATTIIGALTSNEEYCATDSDCQLDETYTYNSNQFDAKCVEVKGDVKVCCYEPKRCDVGVLKLPPKECKTTTDCSKDGKSWCDDKNGKCCHDPNNDDTWKCPDGATPAFKQGKCSGSVSWDKFSGTCDSDPNAICYYGRCCPSTQKDGTSWNLGKYGFTTMETCKVGEMVPQPYAFAYCHESRIVVAGKDSIKKPFSSYKKCSSQSQCSADGTEVCVSRGEESRCVPNILHEDYKETKEVNIWDEYGWHITAIVIVIGIIIIAIFIFVCTRQKEEQNIVIDEVDNRTVPQKIADGNRRRKQEEQQKKWAFFSWFCKKPCKKKKAKPRNENRAVVLAVSKKRKRTIPKESREGSERGRTILPVVPVPPVVIHTVVEIEPRGVPKNDREPGENTRKEKRSVPMEIIELDASVVELGYYHGLLPIEFKTFFKKFDFLLAAAFPTEKERKEDSPVFQKDGKYLKLWLHVRRTRKRVEKIEIRKDGDHWHLVLDNVKEEDLYKSTSISRLIGYYTAHKIPGFNVYLGASVLAPNHFLKRGVLDLNPNDILGAGAFSTVCKATFRGEIVAVKIPNCKTGSEDEFGELIKTTTMLTQEIALGFDLHHRNVVQTYGIVADSSPVLAVMEYCIGGCLSTHLKESGARVSFGEKLCYMFDASRGIQYLHENRIIHRDIAARNFLISHFGVIKVCDFGMSVRLAPGQDSVILKLHNAKVPVRWCAPESLALGKDKTFSLLSDMYGLAGTFYEVLNNGEKIWPEWDNRKIGKYIRDGRMPFEMVKELDDLMKEMWVVDPAQRINIDGVCRKLHEKIQNTKIPAPEDFELNKIKGVERTMEIQERTDLSTKDTMDASAISTKNTTRVVAPAPPATNNAAPSMKSARTSKKTARAPKKTAAPAHVVIDMPADIPQLPEPNSSSMKTAKPGDITNLPL